MVSNRRLVVNGPDYYPTPEWGTRALLAHIKFEGSIFEPCCGDGAMAEVLKQAGYEVAASDKYDRGYGEVRDFFECHECYDNIVTNPPFNIAEDVLSHALTLTSGKVCLLLRTAFVESQRRWSKFYRSRPPSKLLVFSERLSMYPKGSTVNGGGTTSYSWFIWDNNDLFNETKLVWIKPGLKPKTSSRKQLRRSLFPATGLVIGG